MARTRLRHVITDTEATVAASFTRWLAKDRSNDILIYSIVVQFLTSKEGILVKFEHGGTGPRTTYEKYSHPTRHGSNQSHCTFRFDRPEFVPKTDEIALAARTNEATETITVIYEYEVLT